MSMDPELKKKWVEALRSGDYEQGETRLYTGSTNQFCCLGVLCKVVGLEIGDYGNVIVGADPSDDDYAPIYPIVGKREVAADLWCLNDGVAPHRKHSFEEIASYIEENL